MNLFDTPTGIRRAAMDLLARREYGREELSRKLIRLGMASDNVNAELEKLEREGLLNESRYLESFIRIRANSGYGPCRIREELLQKGISVEKVDQSLADSDIDWSARLYDIWCRKYAGQAPTDTKEKARQGRFLSYRGFSMESITQLFRDVFR